MTTQMSGERSQLAALPLDDKVVLLTGADSWRIPGCDALGRRTAESSTEVNDRYYAEFA